MRYLLRKLGFYAIAAWMAVTLNFALPRLIPGDPVQLIMARQAQQGPVPPGEKEALAKMLGLGNGNIFVQYWDYLVSTAQLKFGLSVTFFPTPVSSVLNSSVLWTLLLVGVSTVISVVIGITLGTVAGWKRGTWLDSLVPSTTFLAAIPYFWFALLLLYLLTQIWPVFPGNGGYDPGVTIGWNGAFIQSAVQHAALPAITIVLSSVGGWLLGMRNMMVSTLSEDYVSAAEAKGLKSRTVMIGYAARNAVLPSVAGFAISLGFVVSGSLVMEMVFSYPGIGYTLFQAVSNNDYPLMQAVFLVITFAVLSANFLVDMLYGFVDPRTRQAR
ncbi:ABC transporter permease [Streptomyces himalayensis]|uniref:ABC transporter permease n=1 Tax=Streptomyces himalayensis subsp. himalayensis TaxID=2756131 RepID=A0A7W0DRY9_9ACTN|nr:ABC transporter permease [Streptomyces himalayensis]MBA2950174.1 ABC transporter permease [Streptomyces himalayensis subsp. himalayensis]